jgi:hypothetical protein
VTARGGCRVARGAGRSGVSGRARRRGGEEARRRGGEEAKCQPWIEEWVTFVWKYTPVLFCSTAGGSHRCTRFRTSAGFKAGRSPWSACLQLLRR